MALGSSVRLRARRRSVNPLISGQRASRLAGRGMDHADSRPYVAGDEARHVDWRVTARSGQMHSKRYHAERERVCLLLLDPQPAQFFGTRQRFKSVQAARVGAAAAWWALQQGDRLALLDTGNGLPIRAGSGKPAVMRVLQALVQAYQHPPEQAAQGLQAHLESAARLARAGTLVVITDIARAALVPRSVWQACSRHLQLHLLLLADALELAPPTQALRLAGPDGTQLLDFSDSAVRQQWSQHFQLPLRQLQAMSLATVQVHCLMSDAPADAWLPQTPVEVA